MNQMTSNIVDFKSAEPASGRHAFHENAASGRPGLIACSSHGSATTWPRGAP